MKQVEILGVTFDGMGLEEVLSVFCGYLKTFCNHVVTTPNPEMVMRALRDPDFKKVLCEADLRLPDGVGIVLASKFLGNPVPRKLGGCDTVMSFFDAIKSEGRAVYLLGAQPGVAAAAGKNLETTYPGLRVVGARDGYFKPEEEPGIINEINACKPDILVLGMSMIKQESFALKYKDALNARIIFCLGGSIEVFAGETKRPPRFMRRIGLEWLGRLIIQPKRIKRMADLPRFMSAVISAKINMNSK